MERGLSAVSGVASAHVNFATERATVIFDPTRADREVLVTSGATEALTVDIDQPLPAILTTILDHLTGETT